MLQHLLIKNYALIQHLELNPDQSLNIITGETGAGKSIILGAIGLLLGNRMDTKALYDPAQKCFIEGHFNIKKLDIQSFFEKEELDYEPVTIIRREIAPSGKSRAFINDTPVNLDLLKQIGEKLIDIHSQHDTTALASNEYQLQIVDNYAENQTILEEYKHSFADFLVAKNALNNLEKKIANFKKDLDYNQFQYEELKKVKIVAGELQTIEDELNILENAEDVKIKLQMIAEFLYNAENSAIDYLEEAQANFNSISKYSANYLSLKNRLNSTIIELKDIYREAELALKSVDYDQNSINLLQERINIFHGLLQKHGVKTDLELLEIESQLKEKVETALNIDEEILEAKNLLNKSVEILNLHASLLSTSRQKVLPEIESKIGEYLKDLGMPNAALKLEHSSIIATEIGTDLINILFTANKGIAPQQLKTVASGGEFSRLMLSIKYLLATKKLMPTIIFDEIDTGVSGEISIKVGKMIKEMAEKHQIIAITHLHQMAAQGNSHYFVYKDETAEKTASKIKKLTENERIMEIAQMIGGLNPSVGIIENAKDILNKYKTVELAY